MVWGTKKYLIKWYGYPDNTKTWEPVSNLVNCKSLFDEYEANKLIDIAMNNFNNRKLRHSRRINSKNNIQNDQINAIIYYIDKFR